MPLVYRVEDKYCEGPYRGYTPLPVVLLTMLAQPDPIEDGIDVPYVDKPYFCGFESLEQLKSWFNKSERKELALAGYFLSIYKSNKIKAGKKQVIFDKPAAKLIDMKELDSI